MACSLQVCPLPPTGACCNRGNGSCASDTFAFDCVGEGFEWQAGLSCAQADCSVPVPGICPCDADVNDDGVLNLVDAACILDCAAESCGCCVNSCDINCDGVVDENDAGTAPDDSMFWCVFQGGSVVDCCPVAGSIPAASHWGVLVLELLLLCLGTTIFARRRPCLPYKAKPPRTE